jgi:hypothetical protein
MFPLGGGRVHLQHVVRAEPREVRAREKVFAGIDVLPWVERLTLRNDGLGDVMRQDAP